MPLPPIDVAGTMYQLTLNNVVASAYIFVMVVNLVLFTGDSFQKVAAKYTTDKPQQAVAKQNNTEPEKQQKQSPQQPSPKKQQQTPQKNQTPKKPKKN